MVLNYEAIGVRIKAARLNQNMSQERLAELAGLSTTHTSHVENGSTKVSLPSLVKIANALKVSLDELVCDSVIKSKAIFEDELAKTINDCNEFEIRIISDMAKTLKASMRKNKILN
ncbi:MAG: helix-turn-helix transcriptional regulator [Anaerocolumna aminovalerica]|jgi:transcriptional regulator with XRE-family HTH domain|uniref:helix-turn-helix domain-containing protein n=1 Tax=Anaerocolumna aminovalerica TaxID=1527 RepID=UPI002914CC1F|nr:helix-turn-helix transcriptional regulator [Anaerocolumna aminovalerica]MDU6266344.1 helix-turn-helix transcriptional regulator [Anaerocolumna aminovalerica]